MPARIQAAEAMIRIVRTTATLGPSAARAQQKDG